MTESPTIQNVIPIPNKIPTTLKSQYKWDIFLNWLHDFGGTFEIIKDDPEPNPKRKNYEPKYKPTCTPLNETFYSYRENGSVKKLFSK